MPSVSVVPSGTSDGVLFHSGLSRRKTVGRKFLGEKDSSYPREIGRNSPTHVLAQARSKESKMMEVDGG